MTDIIQTFTVENGIYSIPAIPIASQKPARVRLVSFITLGITDSFV